ncbi:hypothetical protein GCM10011583_58940 [Streptomyces camponoticapitis]|uniref:WXG100 family type VII secretion target n=1 Tax=Streptomyces camponoticapitis TaxID=1616125 RepID=A0ABQ2ENZ7_9ACTN|nr:hypothetical protein [Streptomyces camponoticapitis]GGK19302.1 hypothetical protein GCM10011583_58940 [Streptomyces camponoticapitis]
MAGMAGYSGGLRALADEAGEGPGGSGAATGERLRHSDGPWTRAAGGAEVMRTQMAYLKAEFETAHEGVAGGGEGLGVVGALATVRTSWERRIEAARDECGSLAGPLRAVAGTQGEHDTAIRSGLAGVDAGAGR